MSPFLREPVALCATDDLRRFSRQALVLHDLEEGTGPDTLPVCPRIIMRDPRISEIADRIWQTSCGDKAEQSETSLVSLGIRRLSVSITTFPASQSFVLFNQKAFSSNWRVLSLGPALLLDQHLQT